MNSAQIQRILAVSLLIVESKLPKDDVVPAANKILLDISEGNPALSTGFRQWEYDIGHAEDFFPFSELYTFTSKNSNMSSRAAVIAASPPHLVSLAFGK